VFLRENERVFLEWGGGVETAADDGEDAKGDLELVANWEVSCAPVVAGLAGVASRGLGEVLYVTVRCMRVDRAKRRRERVGGW